MIATHVEGLIVDTTTNQVSPEIDLKSLALDLMNRLLGSRYRIDRRCSRAYHNPLGIAIHQVAAAVVVERPAEKEALGRRAMPS